MNNLTWRFVSSISAMIFLASSKDSGSFTAKTTCKKARFTAKEKKELKTAKVEVFVMNTVLKVEKNYV